MHTFRCLKITEPDNRNHNLPRPPVSGQEGA